MDSAKQSTAPRDTGAKEPKMATTHIHAPSQPAIDAANAAAESALVTMGAAAKVFETDPTKLPAFLAATVAYKLASKRAQAMRDAEALDIESSDD